ILRFPRRGTIREHRRIKGSIDCLTAYFCTPCELTQESRELDAEEQETSSQTEVTPLEMEPEVHLHRHETPLRSCCVDCQWVVRDVFLRLGG
ncbi:hypothetical protein BDN67DRAFT_902116, partial [Paxillus ammoniavirescens]